MYWYVANDKTETPVGFFVDDCSFLGDFTDNEPPVIASFNSGTHPDATKSFIDWVLSKCSEGKNYVKKETPDEGASESEIN